MKPVMSPTARVTHGHSHMHPHQREQAPGPSDAGSVVLEIGPGAGAAVLVTRRSMCGEEIEIRSAGTRWNGTHVAVRQRNGAGTTQYAAIFGSLPEGAYEFRVRGDRTMAPVLALHVDEARVALAHWPVDL